MNTNMTRAEADAHRAQLLHTATTASHPESSEAWAALRDFNAARRVRAGFGARYEQQQRTTGHLQTH